MAEYIDREMATEIIDNYAKTISKDCLVVYQAIRDIVQVICPAVEVEPVVHCKNCKCYEFMSSGNKYFCNEYGGYVTENDYCSRCEVEK